MKQIKITSNAELKISLEQRIRTAAADKSGKLNLKQFAKQKLHRDICRQLVELSDTHESYPICYLVYFAIGKNAHRTHVFESGYNKIDIKKAETILKWLELFAKHNDNPKLRTNSDLSHVLTKYYEKMSEKTSDFRKILKTYEKNPKIANFKTLAIALNIE